MALMITCPWDVPNQGIYYLKPEVVARIRRMLLRKGAHSLAFRHHDSGILEALIVDAANNVIDHIFITAAEWQVFGV